MAKVCVTSIYVEGVHNEDPISLAITRIKESLLNWEWFRIDRTEKDATGLVRHIGTLYRDGETLERGLFYRGRSFGMPDSVPLYLFFIDVYPDYMRVNVFEQK